MAMTETALRKLCRDQELYSTPALNEVLYCNNQGFSKIGGLERYTSLRSLFLEGNALESIEGIPACGLTCLYVQRNYLTSLEGLERIPQLRVLDVSSNRLSDLRGLGACRYLSTLICGDNLLTTSQSVAELAACPQLETLDLQSNKLEGPEVVEFLSRELQNLCSLYLKENPLLERMRPYRKRVVAAFPKLTYLDDRPVFDQERLLAGAWATGVAGAEEKAKREYQDSVAARERENLDALRAMRAESFRKRRLALGLPDGDTDPFFDTLVEESCEEEEADGPLEAAAGTVVTAIATIHDVKGGGTGSEDQDAPPGAKTSSESTIDPLPDISPDQIEGELGSGERDCGTLPCFEDTGDEAGDCQDVAGAEDATQMEVVGVKLRNPRAC